MAAESIELRIGRIEGKIDHLATREDFANLETAVAKGQTRFALAVAGLFIVQTGVLAAIVKLL